MNNTSFPKSSSPQSSPGPRRLTRSGDDKMVAGVAGGLARHFDIDVALVRIAFVALTLFGGSGLLLYLVAWLVLPADSTGADVIEPDRTTPHEDTEPAPPITMQAIV